MGLRAWTKRQARKAKKAAKKAGGAIEKTAKDTGKAIDDTAKQAVREAEALARKADEAIRGEIMSILDDAKKLATRAKTEVEELAKKATREIEAAASVAKHELEGVAKTAQHEIEGAAKEVAHQVEKLPELAEDAVKQALAAAVEAIAAGALTKALKVVKVLAPKTFGLKIGPVTMTIDDIQERIDTLEHCANHPPSGTAGIKAMILALTPSSVGIEFGVEASLLVVNVDALEVAASFEWDTAEFVERFEDLLDAVA